MIRMAKKIKAGKKKRYVPSELIERILHYLPCKSLIKFKIVCKHWNSCIEDSQFINEYRQHAVKRDPSYFIIIWNIISPSTRELNLYDVGHDSLTLVKTEHVPHRYDFMLPSSNGLVCLHGFISNSRSIALFNPITKAIMELPDYPKPLRAFEIRWSVGPHQFSKWCCNELGFGFDPKGKKYKLVQLVRGDSHTDDDHGISTCYILTVTGTNIKPSCWKQIDASLNCRIKFLNTALCVNGVLYWENRLEDHKEIQIIVFDLNTEETKLILSPGKWRYDRFGSDKRLVELQGNLCFYEMAPPNNKSLRMDIWMLKYSRSNVEWISLYSLELGLCLPSISPVFPLCIRHNKILLRDDKTILYSYDIKEKTLKIYNETGEVKPRSHWWLINAPVTHVATI